WGKGEQHSSFFSHSLIPLSPSTHRPIISKKIFSNSPSMLIFDKIGTRDIERERKEVLDND
ncbi:MAG: hypothetical protein KDG51_12005, partial [Calditrichaeota bacterium]|nr:hypothetical protein [Calditrichota bacterium]